MLKPRPLHPVISGRMGGPDIKFMMSNQEVLSPNERQSISNYLRSSSMVLAWMEHTWDLIGRQFGVPGGSAIMSDGEFYWRLDGASYVETYGIQLAPEFIEHGNRLGWQPQVLPDADLAALESYFDATADQGPSAITVTYPHDRVGPRL